MMELTDEQKEIIESPDQNLLVTASAGSGKTAVMVRRILKLISDPASNASLDNMVIMTFTNAAALEMKARIREALDEEIEKHPENTKLKIQKLLLPTANISTIHSFCQRLIREHYEDIGADPDFRVAREDEILLMKKDILNDIFEEKFADTIFADSAFIRMMEAFTMNTMDSRAQAVILGIHSVLMATPWPEDTLRGFLYECTRELEGRYEDTDWFKAFTTDLIRKLGGWEKLLLNVRGICFSPNGPQKYAVSMDEGKEICDSLGLALTRGYEATKQTLDGIDFMTLPAITKKDNCDEKAKKYVKGVRDDFKAFIKKLKEDLFLLSTDEQKMATGGISVVNKELLEITADFMKRFQELKRKKNVLDFDDLEHFALEILYTGESHEFSQTAQELAKNLSWIMIDEYQDSSFIQEALINALSGERLRKYNVFMVGDVKQSIYRFRNAKPQIFTDKLDTYQKDGRYLRKIELNKNFRSRTEILDSVNDVFSCIMGKDLGRIEYDQDAALKAGACFARSEKNKTEILILDTVTTPDDEIKEEKTAANPEFEMISLLIKKLVSKEKPEEALRLTDASTGLRPASYGDITVLMKKNKPARELKDVLSKNGIPVWFDQSGDYFENPEVNMIKSFLNILDNPLQDIPLVTVMRGPIGMFTDDELAQIETFFLRQAEGAGAPQPGDYYRALLLYAGKDPVSTIYDRKNVEADGFDEADIHGTADLLKVDDALKLKLNNFLSMLDGFRELSGFIPVYELLNRIYRQTGYYSYISALKDGEIRQKNLDRLLEKAADYQDTNYQGVFDFVRYIEDLEKNGENMTETADTGESEDMVRISTIHKSKGLEYPIVILAQTFSGFSGDRGEKSIITDERGIGADYIDLENNIKYPGLKKSYMKEKNHEEDVAEEERLLYVAMTRAKEKLIITGARKKATEAVRKILDLASFSPKSPKGKYAGEFVVGAKTYMEWILYTYAEKKEHFDLKILSMEDISGAGDEKPLLKSHGWEELQDEEKETAEVVLTKEGLSEGDLLNIFDAQYPYEEETRLRPKISVSEIKEMEAEELMSTGKILDLDEEGKPMGLRSEAGSDINARRGTAFHRAMALLNFEGSAEDEYRALMQNPCFQLSMKELVDKEAVINFLKSDIYSRMSRAKSRKELYREQHFMAGIPACELKKPQNSRALQILQGIVDVYFIEDGEVVLLDYKTDRVDSEEVLLLRYAVQLRLYARALRQLTGLRIKQCIIYSTFLNREIVLN